MVRDTLSHNRFGIQVVVWLVITIALLSTTKASADPSDQNIFSSPAVTPCLADQPPPALPSVLLPTSTTTLGIPGYLLPSGMSYFGVGTQVGSPYLKNNLLVADSSMHCTAAGYDQTLALNWASLASTSDPGAHVFTYYTESPQPNSEAMGNPSMCRALLGAGELAQLDDYKNAHPGCFGGPATPPATPSYTSVLPVAGTTLSIAYAFYPADQDELHRDLYPTLEVLIFRYMDPSTPAESSPPVPVTSMSCALPFQKETSCQETLSEWVRTQLPTIYGTTDGQAERASAALRARIQGQARLPPVPLATPAAGEAAPAEGCTAPLNAGVETNLADLKKIPLKLAPRKVAIPAIAQIDVSVDFIPFEFHLCEQGLLGASIEPGAFTLDAPRLTLSDQDVNHNNLGPFVYSAESHGWETIRGSPVARTWPPTSMVR